MIVRLKVARNKRTDILTREFQFYDSPIKSEKGCIQAVSWV